jgi:hypothetical protein
MFVAYFVPFGAIASSPHVWGRPSLFQFCNHFAISQTSCCTGASPPQDVVEGADGVYTSFMGHIVVIGRKLKNKRACPNPSRL